MACALASRGVFHQLHLSDDQKEVDHESEG